MKLIMSSRGCGSSSRSEDLGVRNETSKIVNIIASKNNHSINKS